MPTPVITLMPDYGGAFLWMTDGSTIGDSVGPNIASIGDTNQTAFSIPINTPVPADLWRALCQWQNLFEHAEITPVGGSLLLDWDDFHRQGLSLAVRLKLLVGDAAQIRYKKPREDPQHYCNGLRLILADGTTSLLPPSQAHVDACGEIPWRVSQRVHQRLSAISQAHDVEILHAIESGSRAWGFASPDSDFDVRFIYVHRKGWYSTVFEQRDVIESPIEEVDGAVFDVNGWDLRKALRLLYKSNPVLIEWLQSPIVYAVHGLHVANGAFLTELLALAKQFHSPKAAHYHYFHMARKNFREHLCEESIKLKKYFYVLRPVLACLWIERGMGLPPMTLVELMEGVLPAGALRDEVIALRAEKMRTPEFGSGPRRPLIHAFLQVELDRLAQMNPPKAASLDAAPLDAFLQRWAVP